MRLSSCFAATAFAAGLSLAFNGLAQVVVLDARGPSSGNYPQGSVLAPTRMIALKTGDQLDLLDASGSHTLVGPATMPAGQISKGASPALLDVFRRASASRPGIAAVRGFSLEAAKPDGSDSGGTSLWRLDVDAWAQAEPTDPRGFCLVAGRAPVLWRDSAVSEGRFVIYRDADHMTRTVSWPAGAHVLPWPEGVGVADGALYSLNLDDHGATLVRWRVIPAGAANLTTLATALLDNSCFDQLDSLQSQVVAK